jgi:phage FluMu gp28-like protein
MSHVAPISEQDWKTHRAAAVQTLPTVLQEPGAQLPDVLLGYQKQLLQTTATNQVTLVEKSRRIGATWGIAADAVLTAGSQKAAGGMDTMYIGYNMDMAREFVDACAMWARAFMPAAMDVAEFLFADQDDDGKVDRHIQAYRIRFASGFEIVALSSKPRSLRGRQGFLIFDEAAFHDDLDQMMKAALAFLIWGGKILVISTHDGEDNAFNELIKEARSGKKPYAVLRITFDEAVEDGLYKRVCLTTQKPWTPEGEKAWVDQIRKFYGDHAEEELDAIPSMGSGKYLPRVQIEACMKAELPVIRYECPAGFMHQSDDVREGIVKEWCEETLAPILEALDPTARHFFGEDFGRKIDLSVFWVISLLPTLVRRSSLVVELRNVPFTQQEQILKFIVDRLPRFSYGALDARGNGAYLAERAQQKYGALAIEQVQLSERWYIDHMPKLKSHIQDRTIELPKDALILDDFGMLKLIKGVARVPDERSGGKDAKRHGDAAIAAALAVYASTQDPPQIGHEVVSIPRDSASISDFIGV